MCWSYAQSKEILLNLGMECWNLAFNAQGSRAIIVLVQVEEVKNICSSTGGGQEKGKTRRKPKFTTQIGGKTSLGPSYCLL
jgi:hypothetical protein